MSGIQVLLYIHGFGSPPWTGPLRCDWPAVHCMHKATSQGAVMPRPHLKKQSAGTLPWIKLNSDKMVLLICTKSSLYQTDCFSLTTGNCSVFPPLRSKVWVSSLTVLYLSNSMSLDIPSDMSQLQMSDPSLSCINRLRMGRINETQGLWLKIAFCIHWGRQVDAWW